jgi:hypothetical protein
MGMTNTPYNWASDFLTPRVPCMWQIHTRDNRGK